MNYSILLAGLAASTIVTSALAGETHVTSKDVVPPVAPVYGTGFYLGLQAGINAYQDFGGTRRYNVGGNNVAIEANENIGFVGGLKAGYVFGTGTVRPTIEADFFYNALRVDLDARVNGNNTNFNADGDMESGAFMANFILRFAFDRFQPYVGAGAGWWVAQVNDIDVTVGGNNFDLGNSSGSDGFAWQLIAGADYYFTEKFSAFLEYKFLNYEDAGINEDRIGQQIVVLGLRWHL